MTRRVLIVDDDPTVLEAMSSFFRSQGYAVEGARGRQEALDRIAGAGYSLVITDLRLGGRDDEGGLDVVSAARASAPASPVIVLAAHCDSDTERRARERGADVVAAKPRSLWELARVAAELAAGED